GMHYTGMAAAIFSLTTPAVAEIGYASSANIQLALGVAALTVIILFMALLASAQTLARQRGELIEADPNGVLVVESHGRIETVNGRLTKLFGYCQGELLGQPVELLLPERIGGAMSPYALDIVHLRRIDRWVLGETYRDCAKMVANSQSRLG